jgi:hypothetical protein
VRAASIGIASIVLDRLTPMPGVRGDDQIEMAMAVMPVIHVVTIDTIRVPAGASRRARRPR